MASLPRIITVDSSGSIARIVRSAMDLLNLSIVQIDVPSATMALEEMDNINLVVCAYELDLDNNMKGVEFALRVKQVSPDSAILILAGEDDPELDEETMEESPFVYLSRPLDVHQFIRVVLAGLESQEAMKDAVKAPAKSAAGGGATTAEDLGPIPTLNMDAAVGIIDTLLADLGAMAITLADRSGQTLIERGAIGYIDKDELASAMQPLMLTNIDMKELVGGQVTTVQLIDGDQYDVFVLSIGLHHFMCVMFDGQAGSRQFGIVNRFGRRAVEDLIALLGANAFFISKPEPKAASVAPPKRVVDKKRKTEETERVELARFDLETIQDDEATGETESSMPQLDAIPDDEFDLDKLFGADADVSEDLFDLDKMGELAKQNEKQSKTLDWDSAVDLGVLGSNK